MANQLVCTVEFVSHKINCAGRMQSFEALNEMVYTETTQLCGGIQYLQRLGK
jgi:hypothetical protein